MRHKLDFDINEISAYNTTQINPVDIAGYIIRRSCTSRLLFNVFGVDFKDELLFCAASDLSAEKAMAFAEALNEEYYPVVQSPTEGMFVDCCFKATNAVRKV